MNDNHTKFKVIKVINQNLNKNNQPKTNQSKNTKSSLSSKLALGFSPFSRRRISKFKFQASLIGKIII